MSCKEVFGVVLAIALLSSCTSEFCTRHSDCPPAAQCGATGVCVEDIVGAVDANSDAVSDASGLADASERLDANVADAMVAGDGGMSPDGGTHLLDAGLSPPADAGISPDSGTDLLDAGLSPPADAMGPDTGDLDAGSVWDDIVGPAPGGDGENFPHTGSGEVTEELDAGLAP